MSIKSQLFSVFESLPSGVKLVAVSKTHPAEAVAEAYAAGQRLFGENRPQEMVAKYDVLPKDIEWHMIGHLQTNKVRSIAPFVAMIHSVDSPRLAECVDKEARRCGRVIDVLFEIHVADEQTKSGWNFEQLQQYVASGAMDAMTGIRVRGVMTVATNTADQEQVRREFADVARYKSLLAPYFDSAFDVVSMGMSHDYPVAIECGSNMVRVGSKIFGERDYSL